ncbi:hypothetical protein GCM10022255_099280 [Dactylosporangium darangshiense]|uniref:Uncharacterized protein n=1 Tax=Dactylosporangium darangshiense TaxID=579108 RepID=A0ABP8DRK6_9ACTN
MVRDGGADDAAAHDHDAGPLGEVHAVHCNGGPARVPPTGQSRAPDLRRRNLLGNMLAENPKKARTGDPAR